MPAMVSTHEAEGSSAGDDGAAEPKVEVKAEGGDAAAGPQDGEGGVETKAAEPAADSADDQEETIAAVQSCLEELLSKESLAEDTFIKEHMDVHYYVPLCILGGHHRIAQLGPGADVSTLLAAAKRSDKLGVDEGNLLVRPLIRPKRNTLILHDLPDGVTEEELLELFAKSPESDSLCSVKPDVNRTAFASFKTDEAAQRGALWLRSQNLRDSAVKCSVKSDQFMRSFFPAAAPVAPGMTSAGMPNHQQPVIMWGPYWPSAAHGADASSSPMLHGKDYDGGRGCGKGKGPGHGKGEGPPAGLGGEAPPSEEEPIIGEHDEGLAEIGYQHEFRRYTREEIIEVCNKMEEIEKPESYMKFEEENRDASFFLPSPCKEWAPMPAPQMSFASSPFLGESRRSSSMDMDRRDSDFPDAANGRPPRKASSSSWSRTSRSLSGEYQEEHDWDWTNDSDTGPWRRRTRSTRRSTWGEWYGPQWVEKPQGENEPGWRSQWSPKMSAWTERAKGSEKGGAQQRWQAKTKAEQEECGDQGRAEEASGATGDEGGASSPAREPDPPGGAPGKGDSETAKPSAEGGEPKEGTSAAAKPTWADKVRLGSLSPQTGPSA